MLVMPARFQEEWGGEIDVSVLPRRWRCGQSSNPHARKRRHGLAGWQGGGMQRRVKLSSGQRLSSVQAPG